MQLAPGCRSLLDPNDRKRAERAKAAEEAAEAISLAFDCGGSVRGGGRPSVSCANVAAGAFGNQSCTS